MKSSQALTINLPPEIAEMVEAKVRSGEYASESEVILDGLLSLAERDSLIDQWIAEDVVPTLDAINVDPSLTMSLDEAKKRLYSHIDRLVAER